MKQVNYNSGASSQAVLSQTLTNQCCSEQLCNLKIEAENFGVSRRMENEEERNVTQNDLLI